MRMLSKASEDRIIDVYFVTVPESGGNRSFAIGITKIDFKTGIVINPDGTIEELSRRLNLVQDKDVMHSISIHSDHDMKFRLNSSGQQTVDADFLFQLPFVTYTTLEIECEYVTNLNLFACTNPQATLGTFKVTSMTQQTILGDGVELDTYDSITSLLSNLNRIRYQIKILSGEANWDDAPDTDLSSIDTIVSTHEALSTNVHGVGVGNSVASDDDIATHEADTSVHGVAEVADKATVSDEIDADIATHANDTSTHGVTGEILGTEDKDAANGVAGLNANKAIANESHIITTVSNNTTLTVNYYTTLVDATAGDITITLPAAAANLGRVYNIKKIDASAHTVTIDGDTDEAIDGAATAVIGVQWNSLTIHSNGTGWFII